VAIEATTGAGPIGVAEPAPAWTEEFLHWGEKVDLTHPRRLTPSEGWIWLKAGRANGRLIGGCLESLQHLRGTDYWPDREDALLFADALFSRRATRRAASAYCCVFRAWESARWPRGRPWLQAQQCCSWHSPVLAMHVERTWGTPPEQRPP